MKIPNEESLVKIVEREGISAIWLVPIIALVFGAWLVFDAVSQRGVFITVQFDNVGGIVPGKTEVRYKGLTAGIVKAVEPSEDLQSVIVEIEMAANTKPYLTDKATFWYVTADISLKGISDIDTLLSGSYINIQPDIKEEGRSKRHFVALKEEPALEESIPGLHISLQAKRLGSLAKHSPVTFRQITVGYVSNYKYVEANQNVEVNLFIEPEYAHLVKENSRFWNASGIQVSASLSQGVKMRASSLASVVSGGIAFDHPDYEPEAPAVESGKSYVLHSDFESAQMGHDIELVLQWDSGIDIGAAIMYQGLTLGRIHDFIKIDPQQRYIRARAKINPRVRPYLTEQAEFYVVSPKLSLSGVSNMGNLLTGSHINVRPSTEGPPASEFEVFNQKPAYKYSEPGLHLILSAQDIASISPGVKVYYKQQAVGNVQAVEAEGPGQFLVHIFIKPEFQHYVAKDSRFWNVSGLKVSGGLQDFELQAQSMQSVLMGGIAFDTGLGKAKQPKNGDKFQLFLDEETAMQRIEFDLHVASAKGLSKKTRLMYRGEKLGSIHDIVHNELGFILRVGIRPEYQYILRKDSQFWLVNPQVTLSGLTDTDALFGGSYISVNVGQGEVETEFWATNTPPAKHLTAAGLQLTLKADSGNVVTPGSPISYRGIVVGQVDNIALDEGGENVSINITVDDEYRHLINGYTRFYDASGVTVSGSLRSFVVKTESVDSVLRGGISFYNPQTSEELAVAEGDDFSLYANVEYARSAGMAIRIHFDEISGLKSNTKIKYQDQLVGMVERLVFDPNGYGLTAVAYLNDNGRKFAAEGSKFWLAQPQLGLVGSKNLGALLDGSSIHVLPGNGALKTAFDAENTPPVKQRLTYGLNLKLTADRLGSVRVGNPVLYRQVQVGQVIGVDLSPTADRVDIFINIAKRYMPLVTKDSKFWNISGFKLDAGLFSGVEIDAESIESLLAGGIEFATPASNGQEEIGPVEQGAGFRLYPEAEEEWWQWQPQIAIGQ